MVSSAAWRLWPGRRVGGCKLGCWTSLVRSQPRRLGQFLELLKQRERRGVSRRARIQPVLSGKHDLSDRVGLRSQPSGILFPLGRTVVPMTKAAAANIRRSRSRRLRASHRRPRLLWLRRLLYEALPRQADRPAGRCNDDAICACACDRRPEARGARFDDGGRSRLGGDGQGFNQRAVR